MTIAFGTSKLHWNYFLALEQDMERVARYIEFCEPNLSVFSVELARLLFGAASEVDVLAKLLCEEVAPGVPKGNIDQYRAALVPVLPDLPATEVFVPRYGLSFKPWVNWANGRNPDWWRSYNNVKHERNSYYDQATLKNALNALGALLVLTFYYYYAKHPAGETPNRRAKETTRELVPESTLIRLHDDYYYSTLIAG